MEFQSGRHFQVWRYTVSHAQLLLRSTRDDSHTTRIDVLFKGVDRVDLPTSFNGLSIEQDGAGYRLTGEDWSGFVAAVACLSAEDHGQYFDPSPFESNFDPAL
jgi:hypothetical protein